MSVDDLIKHWTDIATATAALVAVIISMLSYSTSNRALSLAERQDLRKKPKLKPILIDSGFDEDFGSNRIYSFHISVGNPTDSDNAIARVELHLQYYATQEALINVKIPATKPPTQKSSTREYISVPHRIAAHDTASGWFHFEVNKQILNGNPVQSQQVIITDSHQAESTIDVLVISRKKNV